MGLMDKIMFWKHDDLGPAPDMNSGGDTNLGMADMGSMELPGMEKPSENLGMPDLGGDNTLPKMPSMDGSDLNAPSPSPDQPQFSEQNIPSQPSVAPPQQEQPQQPMPEQSISNKDIEIISVKLDSLKTTLEVINERIARLEKLAEGEGPSRRY